MRRERLYLEDILTAADTIAEFVHGQELGAFEANDLLRSTVAHQLTIIGEAVAHLSSELRERYPDVPWTDIKGVRDIIVHHYFGIDWEEV
ncbi:MAG: HepT-like ribonuclease domain-containing protein [Acidobacteriota bacterium]